MGIKILRQVFVLKSGEVILEHHFAMGYNNDDLSIVLDKIKDFFVQPMPNKLFHRPLLDFQIVYGQFGLPMDIFYLFVTDLADRPSYIEDEIKKLSKSVKQIGSILEKKEEILDIIKELHTNLHAKITLVGPMGGGKTKLAQILAIDKEAPPRKIMTFAEVREINIDKLHFDLWDFIMDNFSPLWNNYIRGSDLILLIFNSAQINEKMVINFINLSKREGKYSKIVVLLSHSNNQDIMSEEKFISDYGELIPKVKILSYDIENENVEAIVTHFISEVLMLKKGLPPEFREILIESNNYIGEKNYSKAIEGLNKLISIAKEYQEIEFVETFKKKIIELENKHEDHKQKQIVEKTRARIKAPEKKLFKDTFKIKKLPILSKKNKPIQPKNHKEEKIEPYYVKYDKKRNSNFRTNNGPNSKPFVNDLSMPKPTISIPKSEIKLPEPKNIKIDENRVNFKEKKEEVKNIGIKNKRLSFERSPIIDKSDLKEGTNSKSIPVIDEIQTNEIEEKHKKIENQVKEEQKSKLHEIFTTTNIWNTKEVNIEKEKDEKFNSEVILLKNEIEKRGKSLRYDLCEKYVSQVRLSLEKDELDKKDIINAALLYLKKIENI